MTAQTTPPQSTPPFKRGDTFALSGVFRVNGVATPLSSQTVRSQLRTSVGALIANLSATLDPDQTVNPGRFYLSLVDPALSASFPAPANLYCDVEVRDGDMVRSTETFIVPVVPDVSR